MCAPHTDERYDLIRTLSRTANVWIAALNPPAAHIAPAASSSRGGVHRSASAPAQSEVGIHDADAAGERTAQTTEPAA